MTSHLYQDWIQQWDQKLQESGRRILLLQDNASCHIVPDLQNIRVENFEPNLTAHVQPNDQGIIRCFKAHYRAEFIQRAVNRYDEGITPAEIYKINQLQAMGIAHHAWKSVDAATIRNCWRKAGILPDMDHPSSSHVNQPSVPVSSLLHDAPSGPSQIDSAIHAESRVQAALDDLVATGALQKTNRMDIESLLNPASESHDCDLTETSDVEIYQAVMNAIDARKNMEINGGDDDPDTPTEPRPTRHDVLKAASTIGRYIDDLNDPIAHKLESLLGSFKRQLRLEETRSLKNTVLTDFFQPI
jgi:hypothetical protein